ncbi:unnamed protein product [Sphagnum jensenii]|uniref:Uncharacterized protein n=1 Tax=Sphagnum jensenii TaxID=128206 RepID=A0ABP1AGZ3_9BRYO
MCLQGWTVVGERIGQGNNLARAERGLHGNTAICQGSSHFMFWGRSGDMSVAGKGLTAKERDLEGCYLMSRYQADFRYRYKANIASGHTKPGKDPYYQC